MLGDSKIAQVGFALAGVTVLSWLVFGLSAVTFLKGSQYTCNDSDGGVEGLLTCVGSLAAVNEDTGTASQLSVKYHVVLFCGLRRHH